MVAEEKLQDKPKWGNHKEYIQVKQLNIKMSQENNISKSSKLVGFFQ